MTPDYIESVDVARPNRETIEDVPDGTVLIHPTEDIAFIAGRTPGGAVALAGVSGVPGGHTVDDVLAYRPPFWVLVNPRHTQPEQKVRGRRKKGHETVLTGNARERVQQMARLMSAAVPLAMWELWDLSTDELVTRANGAGCTFGADAEALVDKIASGGDEIEYGGAGQGDGIKILAEGIAILALLRPEGVDLLGWHWCRAHSQHSGRDAS